MSDQAESVPGTANENIPPAIADAARSDSGLMSLVLVAQFQGSAVDPVRLKHQTGSEAPMTRHELVRAARQLGFKAGQRSLSWKRLADAALPAIAEMKDGRFLVLAKAGADGVLLHDAVAAQAQPMAKPAFEAAWTGRLIQLATREAAPAKAAWFDVGWFLGVARKYKRLFGEVMLASFCLQLFALVSPLLFQVVIDKVLVHRSLTTLDVLVIAMAVLALFEVLLTAIRSYTFSHTTRRIDVELGARMFRHLLALPMSYFEARRIGDSVARMRELEGVRNFLTGSALTLVIDIFFTFVFFAVMWLYSPLLTGIVIGSIPLYLLVSLIVTPILKKRLAESSSRHAENQAFMVEVLGGVETVKSMAVEPRMQRKWEEQLAAHAETSFHSTHLGHIAGQAVNFISKATTVLLLFVGAKSVIEGNLSVGELVGFNMLAARVAAPILRLSQVWQEFQQMRVSVGRLAEVMNNPAEPADMAGRSTPSAVEGRIELDHVTFRYRADGPPVLSDVSLRIEPGEVIGIVGPSGSGKSTLAKLIQRLAAPEGGRVLVDGMDLALLDPSWLRRQMGVVLQDNVLFNRSVRDNIALADPTASMDRVVAAAKLAGAHEFILELPRAYDSVTGERGATLSGGQRQRLALARALLTDPRILILDEATSALDVESERIIQQNMRRICAGRTVVIIAHRLSTVRFADRILTIEKGRLTEDGTHDELMSRGGRYAALHAIQGGLVVPMEAHSAD